MNSILRTIILLNLIYFAYCGIEEEEHGVIYANNCEACKVLALELQDRLSETGKSHEVIEIGYSVDDVKPKKRTQYKRSQLRFIESLENVCDRVLDYNVHKERKDSTRFAKGMSQTFKTLHGLVDKGVKVDLGIPLELWDKPSAEVTKLKSQCETLLERHEDDVEKWYNEFLEKGVPLIKYLCEDIVLKGNNAKCLYENLKGDDGKEEIEQENKQEKDKDEL